MPCAHRNPAAVCWMGEDGTRELAGIGCSPAGSAVGWGYLFSVLTLHGAYELPQSLSLHGSLAPRPP
jgi:hypothetical protein